MTPSHTHPCRGCITTRPSHTHPCRGCTATMTSHTYPFRGCITTMALLSFCVVYLGLYIYTRSPHLLLPSLQTDINNGDYGRPLVVNVSALTPGERTRYAKQWAQHSFSQYTSDRISVQRRLPDYREQGCNNNLYRPLSDLPKASVVIIFHNEAWSTLLRTVHSVLDRSPPDLVTEVILVDDGSTLTHLGKKLDLYCMTLSKVKVIRTRDRKGLIRARLVGAAAARGRVLVFLDSHCECTEGWLLPLLDRIADSSTNVVCPLIDIIDDTTFQYKSATSDPMYVGGFDWNLTFTWHSLPKRDLLLKKHPTDPTRSPTMVGGLFAIDRNYFYHLGAYDPALSTWGGENLELSFKIWMCGGRLEILPCSHVGHVYRKYIPYDVPDDVIIPNKVRVAEVWMDEYKYYYYQRIPDGKFPSVNVTNRVRLREKLNCRSFDWYLRTVYPGQWNPKRALLSGQVQSQQSGLCVQSASEPLTVLLGKRIALSTCYTNTTQKILSSNNKFWYRMRGGQIRRDQACVQYNPRLSWYPVIYMCQPGNRGQQFSYTTKGELRQTPTGICLSVSSEAKLVMERCTGEVKQSWTWMN